MVTQRTDLLLEGYKSRQVPTRPMTATDLQVFLSQELERLELALQECSEACPQVADSEPSSPRKGTIRYAVSPWDPLGTGDAWVWWNGAAWVAL